MIISVASGKGGTGKTLVAASLALSIGENAQLLDCDVEEPNASIFIKPKIKRTIKASVLVPVVDESKCDFCGKCAEVCEYNAIVVAREKILIFPQLCHSCGACALLCPHNAIQEREREVGRIDIGDRFVQGCLNVGEAMSPPLIRRVKELIDPGRTIIIDSPPGTSCPVIAAVKDSDYCILVTEPTPFGLNDLQLAVEMVRKLGLRFGVVINRADLGDIETERYCKTHQIPILLTIPFDRDIAVLYSKGIPLVEGKPEYKEKFLRLFREISR